MERNEVCWCGSGKKWKKCHFPQQPVPSIAERYAKSYGIIIKTPEQIEKIRQAGHKAAWILDQLAGEAKAGVTTASLDRLARVLHAQVGAIPAPLGYGTPPFPGAICTSINEVICHGIPEERPLQEGDIINIDVTCIVEGFYGDCSRMIVIGKTTPERQKVVDVAYECLMRSIAVVRPGALLEVIGGAIEDYATAHACSVVDQFVGHGVGVRFHEAPQIPHYRNHLAIPLVEGMTFTIEPMINAGVCAAVIDPRDHWTARTADGKASAQWEHTLLVTYDGVEILTPWHR